MAKNIEIKARHDNLERAREIALSLGVRSLGIDRQVDTYFQVQSGRLKVRQSSLSGSYLVPYLREQIKGPKACQYALVPLADGAMAVDLFSRILGVTVQVDKEREIFLFENVRIHLDRVKGLGNFIELEAVCAEDAVIDDEYRKVSLLMKQLEIDGTKLEEGSYQELLVQKSAGTTGAVQVASSNEEK